MSKQLLLFQNGSIEENSKYNKSVEAPIYEPSHEKPHILSLCNNMETILLLREIDKSSLPEDEKSFLRVAAQRHTVFHYERIADYYAHASPEMQRLMEHSALVIIDLDSAIERGFVRLCDDIRKQYLEEYNGEDNAT